MYLLENNELSVSILDPKDDLDRCGSRYCVGGYIYQVTDRAHGPLLAGPQYPNPRPDVFHGQGAPDMFVTPLGADAAPVGGEVGIIGVGRVRRTSPVEPFQVRHNPEVIAFLPWTVEQTSTNITTQTEQTFQNWTYRLARRVSLDGRTIDSHTSIRSLGEAPLPVRWFPHPFFPLTGDGVLCRFSIPIEMAENPGFYVNEDGFVCRKQTFDWNHNGHFQALSYTANQDPLTIVQRHPLVGKVTTVADYALAFLPIWGNDCTFSFEPYLAMQLAQGQEAAWNIQYQF